MNSAVSGVLYRFGIALYQRSHFICILLSIFMIELPVFSDSKSDIEAGEYDLKAAIALNVCKFITGPPEWTESFEAFNIGVLGPKELFTSFRQHEGRTVGGKPVRVHWIQDSKMKHPCQAVYFGEGSEGIFKPAIDACTNAHVLTIGEDFAQARKTIMVVLQERNRKIRLLVSQARARNAGLEINSSLLNLAELLDNESKMNGGGGL